MARAEVAEKSVASVWKETVSGIPCPDAMGSSRFLRGVSKKLRCA